MSCLACIHSLIAFIGKLKTVTATTAPILLFCVYRKFAADKLSDKIPPIAIFMRRKPRSTIVARQ